MARPGLLAAHGSLWFDDARYRLAWLVAPQALTVVLVALFLSSVGEGRWGKPASSTKERIAELSALRDKAGKQGDTKALAALTAASDDGEIEASTKLGTLYDPLVSASFPQKTVPNDLARAVRLYGPGAETGDGLAVTRLADLLLDPSNPAPDTKRGCRLAQVWRDQPDLDARGDMRLFLKYGQCLLDEGSGLPLDAKRGAETVFAALTSKFEPAIQTYVRKLGLQKPFVIKALQDHAARLKFGTLYTGPVDGVVHPETVAYFEMIAGLRPMVESEQSKALKAKREQDKVEFRYPPGLNEATFRQLAQAANDDPRAVSRMKAYADAGNAAAQAAYAYCYNPFFNKGAVYPPDAQVAAAYYERAARAGHAGAAGQAATLYLRGIGNLPRDAKKAASLTMLQLELDPGATFLFVDPQISNGISGDFWAALQAELASRGFYKTPIENRRNDAVVAALQAFEKANTP